MGIIIITLGDAKSLSDVYCQFLIPIGINWLSIFPFLTKIVYELSPQLSVRSVLIVYDVRTLWTHVRQYWLKIPPFF